MMANEHQSVLESAGEFWLASSPSNRTEGHVVVQPTGRSKVRVRPEFYPAFELEVISVAPDGTTRSHPKPSPDPGPLTLHGLLERQGQEPLPVSLVQAHATHWSGGMQTFEPMWTLIGDHVDKDDRFQGIRVRLPHYGEANSEAVPMESGGTVRVTNGWVELEGLPARKYHELGRTVVRPLCTLLALARGSAVRPSAVEVSGDPGVWCPVHAGTRGVHSRASADLEQLIPTSHLSMKVLATWLERAHALGPLPGAYISVLEIDLSVDAQALILTTVAEGLHRVLYPHTLRFSVEHGVMVREAAVEAVRLVDQNASTVDAVSGFLSHVHEVSYAKRLDELASRAEELVPGVTGKTSKWKKLVYETRNSYAHQTSADWMEEDDLDRVLTTAQSLRWILRLVLLDQAGLDAQLLLDRFTRHQRYKFFLTHAAQWQPQVYGEPGG